MSGIEPKSLAPVRILQILQEHSDYNHPLKQEEIAAYLERDYGIVLERKAIGRHLRDLRDADFPVQSDRHKGSWLDERTFEDAELRMLIDGVLSSKYITAKHSQDLIQRLCNMSSRYFRSHVKNIYSVHDWSKTDNQALFYNIELIDDAIERGVQLKFDFNKYGVDKKLHKSSSPRVTPYQLILHNQRYYLMFHHEFWKSIAFYRVDHITNMRIVEKPATPITKVKGFAGGIDYKALASSLPYMYTDAPVRVEFVADKNITDQIIDWFGRDVILTEQDENRIHVTLKASPAAMEHWAVQYSRYVEVIHPQSLRDAIKDTLKDAMQKYQ